MKSPSSTYITKEEAATRQPAELYRIWRGSTYYYYTSGDVAVTYDGHSYVPATIQRGEVGYNSKCEAQELEVTFSRIEPSLTEYLAGNPVNMAWIEVRKLFRDQSPYEAPILFIGQIRAITIKGAAATAKCVGLDYFIKQPVPRFAYQPECNWLLFSTECGLAAASYKRSQAVTSLPSPYKTLGFASLGGYASPYWVLGTVEFGEYKRMIIAQPSLTSVTIEAPIPDLVVGNTVDLYPGCDGKIATCKTKFAASNVANFGGHPYIPLDNPCYWVTK